MAEKRKFVRLGLRMLVRWKKEGESNETGVHLDVIRNVSRAGLCFVGPSKLERNDALVLEVRLPEGATISACGKVKRVKPLSFFDLTKDVEYEIGIELSGLSDEHQKEWEEFVFKAARKE